MCRHGPAVIIVALTSAEPAQLRSAGTTAIDSSGSSSACVDCRRATMTGTSRPPARWISSAVLCAMKRARSASAWRRLCTRYELKL